MSFIRIGDTVINPEHIARAYRDRWLDPDPSVYRMCDGIRIVYLDGTSKFFPGVGDDVLDSLKAKESIKTEKQHKTETLTRPGEIEARAQEEFLRRNPKEESQPLRQIVQIGTIDRVAETFELSERDAVDFCADCIKRYGQFTMS